MRENAFGSMGAVRGRTVYGSLIFEKRKIPVVRVSGKRPGPVLTVIGMQHTNEYSGPAAMDRVLSALNPADLKGTLVCLPFVNPLQLRLTDAQFHKAWKNPVNNLNRQWPGDACSKNPLSRLAAKVWDEVISKSDALLDYHCCRTVDPRFAACLEGDRGSQALAALMGLDALDLQTASSYAQGLLFVTATEKLGIPAVLIESHPAKFQVREAVEICARSLWRAMAHLGMIERDYPANLSSPEIPVFKRAQKGYSLTAGAAGYLGVRAWPGARVRRGTVVAVVRSIETFEIVETLRSPVAGAVGCVGVSDSALVEKGIDVAGVKPVGFVRPA